MRKTKRPTTPAIVAALSLAVSICMGATGRIVRADSKNGSAQQSSIASATAQLMGDGILVGDVVIIGDAVVLGDGILGASPDVPNLW